MVAVLDTDHFSELIRDSALGVRLRNQLLADVAHLYLSVISAHESLNGWLSLVNRKAAGIDQVNGYLQFRLCLEALGSFSLLDFDLKAANQFSLLRMEYPRLGTMDLKIAAICMVHDAMLLTRNVTDFEQVKGLQVENWIN